MVYQANMIWSFWLLSIENLPLSPFLKHFKLNIFAFRISVGQNKECEDVTLCTGNL